MPAGARWALVFFASLGCGTAAPATEHEATEHEATEHEATEHEATEHEATEREGACVPSYDIVSAPGTTYDDVAVENVIPWPVAGVTFTATVTRVRDAARIEGVLSNTNDGPVSVDFLTGGVMGLSTNPFQIDIEGEAVAAGGPEVYPSPRRAVIPQGGTIVFRSDRCPTFPAHVRWVFTPWSGTPVQGETTLP